MFSRFGFAALAAALVMGCQTAPPERQWSKQNATPEDVKRDLYWCSSLTRDRPRVTATPAEDTRVVTLKVDDECMEKRGYSKVAPKG